MDLTFRGGSLIRFGSRSALRLALLAAFLVALWAVGSEYIPRGGASDLARSRYDLLWDWAILALTGALFSLEWLRDRDVAARREATRRKPLAALRGVGERHGTQVLDRDRAAELEAANKRLRAEIAERVQAEQELAQLLEFSRGLGEVLHLQPLLCLSLDCLRRIVGYTDALVFEAQGDFLVPFGYCGPPDAQDALPSQVALAQSGSFGAVARGRAPVVIADLQAEDARQSVLSGEDRARPAFGVPRGARSWMGIPLLAEDRLIGVINLYHAEPGYFIPHHVRLASIVADQVSVALRNLSVHEEARRTAVIGERERLARELHDSVMQTVYGVVWNIRSVSEMLGSEQGPMGNTLATAASLAKASLADLRTLIYELRPEVLDQMGLAGVLLRHAEVLRQSYTVQVTADVEVEPELRLEAKEALYRIAREALQNAVKHAGASHVGLRLQQTQKEVILEVRDDGVGFDTGASFPGHLGLTSMRERASYLGGHVEIKSAPDSGTQVRVLVPRHPAG